MASYPYGKDIVCAWVRENFSTDSLILDVGACDGAWRRLLHEYNRMDAVEAFKPHMEKLGAYRNAYNVDIRDYRYVWYDLIIFGDVIEHLSPEDAQAVLDYAKPRCRDMIVAVPFLFEQGEIYGNKWERHIQDDLTPDLFDERFPGFAALCRPVEDYCYYHWGDKH